jgi:hypothetical protein
VGPRAYLDSLWKSKLLESGGIQTPDFPFSNTTLLLGSSRLFQMSVCLYTSARLPLKELSWNLHVCTVHQQYQSTFYFPQ